MMGFFLQLKILLWKNFTLKIRNLPVLLLECFIPLVLFAILLAIRAKQPAIPQATASFKPYPLPSAGLLSVLQTFCPNSSSVENTEDSERLKFLLEATEEVGKHGSFLDKRFIAELKRNLSAVDLKVRNQTDETGSEEKIFTGQEDGRQCELPSMLRQNLDILQATLEAYSSFANKVHPGFSFKCNNGHSEDSTASSYRALLTLWAGVHEAVCGEPVSAALVKYLETSNIGELGLTRQQAGVASVFLQALRGGVPKILYAPNGTAADAIIDKATELFSFVDHISRAASKWMTVSDDVRSVLASRNARDYRKRKIPVNNSSDKYLKYESVASHDDEENFRKLDAIDNAACLWSQSTASIDFNVFRGFATESELVNYVLTEAFADNVTVIASLVFVDMPEDGSLPAHVVYKIRQNASLTDSTLFVRERYWSPGPRSWSLPLYYQYGFVLIQDAIERAIIDLHANTSVKHPGLLIHQMPSPCFMHDEFLFMIEHVMPLCVTASWVYVVSMLVQSIVYEKEQRLKEVMRMMGLRNTVHWLAWFLTTFVQMTVTVLTLTLMLKLGHVLDHSNVLIVFLVLELFAITSIMFSFLVSVCYSKAKLAAACAGVIYFLTYVPYMYIAIREEAAGDKIPAWAKSLASLLPTASFGMGIKYFAFYEIQGMGMQWYNMALSPVEDDEFSLAQVIVMLFVDCVIYALLTWYIEHVHPGSYGLPQPWYFPLSKSYWRGHSARDDDWCCGGGALSVMEEDQQTACAQRHSDQDYSHFEPEPTHAAMAVHIDNLTKVFKTGKVAVKNLSLRLYEDQILALLGHNGAGKTTTMSILSGLYPPTHGTASVYGMDIRSDMDNIHKMLGICPQHNVLFDRLTVDEHLWFYCRMKGASELEIKREIERMVMDLGLLSKRHCTVDSLSGGMQRKLSIAISFVSGSRLVILDEPTAGVDPYARRAIWDLLVKYKTGRTILLSTHHMDEADVLGDRIAIISNGSLKCSGSALYLKKMFGEGYHLNLVKKPIDDDSSSNETMSTDGMSSQSSFVSKCSAAKVTDFILRYVDTAYLKCDTGRELQYVLPFDGACKGHFSRLFAALDQHLASLEISSYGVMDTSLEEVFITVNESQQASTQEQSSADTSRGASVMQRTNKFLARVLSKLLRRSNRSRVRDETAEPLLPDSDYCGADGPPAVASQCERTVSPATTIGDSGDHKVDVEASVSPCASVPFIDVQTPATVEEHLSVSVANTKDQLYWTMSEGGASVLPSDEASYDLKHWLLVHGDRQQQQFASSVRSPPVSLVDGEVSSSRTVAHDNLAPLLRVPTSINSAPQTLPVPTSRRPTRSCRSRSLSSNQDVRMWDEMEYVSGSLLYAHQFWAILVKRFHYVWRNRKGLFSQIILPAVFVCVAMTVALSAPQVHDLPPLVLSPAQYYNGTRLQGGSFVPYSIANGSDLERMRDAGAQQLIQTFAMPCGLAATCVLKDSRWNSSVDNFIRNSIERRNYSKIRQFFNAECESVFYNGKNAGVHEKPMYWHQQARDTPTDDNDTELVTSRPWNSRYTPACYCDGSGQRCSTDRTVLPPTFDALTSEHMQNFSGDVDKDYYLYTTDMYRYQRYGGFQFGLTQDFVPETISDSPALHKLAAKHVAMVWYNDKGFHSVPVYVNTMNNAILRANLPLNKGNPSAYGITAINHPMTLTNSLLSIDILTQGSDVLIAIFVIVAMSFVPASFVIFLVYENAIKAKHLQLVSGLNRVIYWLANYVWDMCNYFIPAICCIIILRSFNIPAYVSSSNFPAVILLFFLYGWSITPMMYPSTFFFHEPSSAYIVMIVANLFVGITCIITSFLLEVFQQHDEGLRQIHDVLKYIFLIFPNYCLGRGLIDVAFNEYQNEFYFTAGQYDKIRSPFDWYVTSRNLVAMSIVGVVFFIVTLMCELKPCCLPRREQVPTLYDSSGAEDVDVAGERRRVQRGAGRWDILRLTDLTKLYMNRKLGSHLAVDRLTLSVPEGECFGLLGVNGAGKTTTFRMLTGDLKPTSGDAFVNSYSVVTELAQMQKLIGYCPQFDALYEELTAKEHVELYARLRGIPANKVSEVAEWVLKKLDLGQYTDKLSGTYSGGNKRKLSTAIALVGQPSVIFMDEPTTGMDPHSRRFLWDLILSLVQEGRSVVLTSHSMEECEALCTRLAIMVNGQMKCIGTPQHLKTCYGDGYTLSVRLASVAVEEQSVMVQRFLRRSLPQAVLKESHHNLLQYQLASAGLSLATVFTVMEEAHHDLHIEDYSINQNTLDNVFIGFVKQQKELLQEMQVVAKAGTSETAAAAAASNTGVPVGASSSLS